MLSARCDFDAGYSNSKQDIAAGGAMECSNLRWKEVGRVASNFLSPTRWKRIMRRPGIEPGSLLWQGCMTPLHHRRVSNAFKFLYKDHTTKGVGMLRLRRTGVFSTRLQSNTQGLRFPMRPRGASPAEALGKRLHGWGGKGRPEDLLVPPRPNLNRWGEQVKQLVEAQPPPPNRHNRAGSEEGGAPPPPTTPRES